MPKSRIPCGKRRLLIITPVSTPFPAVEHSSHSQRFSTLKPREYPHLTNLSRRSSFYTSDNSTVCLSLPPSIASSRHTLRPPRQHEFPQQRSVRRLHVDASAPNAKLPNTLSSIDAGHLHAGKHDTSKAPKPSTKAAKKDSTSSVVHRNSPVNHPKNTLKMSKVSTASKTKKDRSSKTSVRVTPSLIKVGVAPKNEMLGNVTRHSVNPALLLLEVVDGPKRPLQRLAYGLDRVLFNHGVYYLRDQRSRVFNFDPYLEKIMPVSEFDFSLLKDYITSSRDTTLLDIAKRCEAQFVGSTSTMTGLLTQLHFLISSWRGVNTSMLSKSINVTTTKFTKMTMAPSSVFLRWRDGVYALDADKSGNPSTILSFLGRSLEKLLLLPTTEFERYRKSNENPINASEQKVPEAYHYTKFGTMLMRSQLDAYDSRLPGSGVFDIKTRAAITIRMDQNEGEASKGYEIRYPHGDWQSYEREYYDLLRSSLLKFSLQVRMGRMDGIYLAYHNVDRLFGFQYMSVSEMDLAIHGQMDTTLGDQEFRASLGILQEILNRATEAFPQQSSRITFHTMEGDSPAMNVFIAPVAEEEIEAMSKSTDDELKELQQLQTKARAHSTASFSTGSENIVNDASRPPVQTFEASPEDGEAKVSQNALEKKSDALLDPPPGSIGLVITVENRVNGKKVDRPRVLTSAHRWTVDFKVKDMPSSSVGRPYRHCQLARKKLFDRLSKDTDVSNPYVNKLRELATRGRSWRKTQDAIDERRENVVFEPYAPTAHGNGKEIDSTKVNTAEKIKGPGDYMTWLYTNACKA